MTVREDLRKLIGSLEARYLLLNDESISLELDVTDLMMSKDICVLQEAFDARVSSQKTLSDVLMAWKSEECQIRPPLSRLQNERNSAVALPFEILAYAFELACHPVHTAQWLGNRMYGANTVHRFRRWTRDAIRLTCVHWDYVVVNASGLWSTLGMSSNLLLEWSKHSVTPLGVQRAADRALSLCLTSWQGWDRNTSPEILFPVALPLFQRCEFLQVAVYWVSNLAILGLLSQPSGLRSVRVLVITHSDRDSQGAGGVPPGGHIDLGEAALLSDLWLRFRSGRRVWYPTSPLLTMVPPASNVITSLYIDGEVNAFDSIKLINSCRRLETLEWNYDDVDDGVATEVGRYRRLLERFPYLQSLSLVGVLPNHLLQDVNSPELVQLRLGGRCFEERHPLFMAPRFPKLRQVTIVLYPSTPAAPHRFSTFFQAHPTIEDVVLEMSYPTLAAVEGEATLVFGHELPNLKTLRLIPSRQARLTPQQLSEIREILQLRMSRASVSQTFKMHISPDWYEADSLSLSDWHNGPVSVNFLPYPKEAGVLMCPGPFGSGENYSIWDKC